jgi:hypothetical protein
MNRRRERRTSIGGQFAARLIEMMESSAYRILSLSARRVLDRIEIEHAHHGGTDNGRLPVTYEHFMEYGIDRDAVAPAIRELEALGFVEVTEHGCAGNAKWRAPNLFRLTFRPSKGIDGDGSHEWRRIKTAEEAQAIAQAARKNKSQSGKTARFDRENPDRKPKFPIGKTPTTVQVGKTPTTSISRVRDEGAAILSDGRSADEWASGE